MKHEDKLELISQIDEKIIDRNTKKRNALWYKTLSKSRRGGRSKNVTIILLAATLALSMVAFGALLIMYLSDQPVTPPDPTEAIVSIELTSTAGDTSVYTITYKDGKTATLDVTDKAPDGSGAKITGVTFDENSNVYLSLATGKLLNMGQAVGGSTGEATLQRQRINMTLTITPYRLLGDTKDATTVSGVSVDEEENMSYHLNNGKHLALGKVHNKTPDGEDESMSMACINEAGELVLGFASGETVNLGRVVGRDGKDGVGIEGINLSPEGELSVTLTNGTVLNLGNIKGQDGIGISESKINDAGELVLTYTDGNTVNLGRVVGEKGEDGVGIASININDAGELTIVLTDGTNLNLGVIKGQDGKSAYELYKEKYGYEGTEEEWLFDLVNGNLATKVKYPVTFDSAGGSEVPTQEVEEGGKVIEPEPPTRAGYTFLGWYYGEELWSFAGYSVTEPITLKAKWEINTYEIVYRDVYPKDKNVGKTSYTVEDEIKVQDLAYYMEDDGNSLEGRTFLGWTYGDMKTPTKDLVIPKGMTGHLTVKAHWDVQEKFRFDTPPVDNRKDVETLDHGAFFAYTAPSSKVYAVCGGVVTSLEQEGDTYTLVLTLDYDLSGQKAVTYKGIGTLSEGIARDARVSAGDVLGQTIDHSLAYIHLTFNGVGKACGSYFSAQALEGMQVSENTYGEHLIISAENICDCMDIYGTPADNVQATVQNGCATITYDKQSEDYPYPRLMLTPGDPIDLDFQPAYLVIRYRTDRQHNAAVIITSESFPLPENIIPVDWNNTGEWDTAVIDVSTRVAQPWIGVFFIDLQDPGAIIPVDENFIDFAYIGLFDTKESADAFAADWGEA